MSVPVAPAAEPLTPTDRPHWMSAAAMAVGYLIVAGAWVWISSAFAGAQSADVDQLRRIELIKGIGFIVMTAVALFAINLTQLRELRARDDRLRHMDRALHNAERRVLAGTFASTVAHDINNGLMATTLPLSELQDRLADQPNLRVLADEAQSALTRIGEWNRRFFDIGGTQLLGGVSDFDLAESVRTAYRMASRHRLLRSTATEVEIPAHAPFRGTESLVQRAVLNLLLNAADAAGPRGARCRLAIQCAGDGGYRVDVDDNGPGVPVERRATILEPFFTTKPDGTGLGLASVVACAALHTGKVEITDSPLGGARFTLVLRAPSHGGATTDRRHPPARQ